MRRFWRGRERWCREAKQDQIAMSKKGCGIATALFVCAFSFLAYKAISPFIWPRYWKFSGAVEDGGGPFGFHGPYRHALAFTPDSKSIAYLWVEGSYGTVPKGGEGPQRRT